MFPCSLPPFPMLWKNYECSFWFLLIMFFNIYRLVLNVFRNTLHLIWQYMHICLFFHQSSVVHEKKSLSSGTPSYLSVFFWKKACSEWTKYSKPSHTKALFGEKKVSILLWYKFFVYSVQNCTSVFIIITNCRFSITWLFPVP